MKIATVETDLRRAERDGWVSAWDRDGDRFTVDHHSEDGEEVRSTFLLSEYEEAAKTTRYTGPDAVLAEALNTPGRLVRNFADPFDERGWGDLPTPDEEETDA